MSVKKYTIISFILIGFPYGAFASSIIINEIAWMGSSPQNGETSSAAANNEWIELKNRGTAPVNLDGWSLWAQDGTPSIALAGSIEAGGFFLLERTNDNTVPGITADMIYTGALSNSGEKLILKDGQGVIMDTVDAASGWSAGSAETKETMQQRDGWITAPATPRAENAMHGSSSLSPSPLVSVTSLSASSSPSPSTLTHAASIKSITAYAGEDVSSMVGIRLELLGHARGINDEPIDSSARFFWNFGDGETQEGRSVAHAYRMPGTYMANVQVSSGEYAASDYIRVQISPNLVGISSVVLGTDGYVRLTNASNIEADISDWKIHDNKAQTFIIPPHTQISRHGDAALPNSVTGLLKEFASLPLTVLYPNGVVAFTVSSVGDTAELQNISKQTQTPPPPAAGEARQGRQDTKIPEEKKSQSIAVITRNSTPSPAPTFEREDKKEYAVAANESFVSFPFMMAIGVGILGAAGFFAVKFFL